MRVLHWLKLAVVVGAVVAPWGSFPAEVPLCNLAWADLPTNLQTVNVGRFVADVEKRINGAPKSAHQSDSSLLKTSGIRRPTQLGQVAIGEVLLDTTVDELSPPAFETLPFLVTSGDEGQCFWIEIRPSAEQGRAILGVQRGLPRGRVRSTLHEAVVALGERLGTDAGEGRVAADNGSIAAMIMKSPTSPRSCAGRRVHS